MLLSVVDQPTILVVDDNPTLRRACQRVLEGAGYRVASAADGEEALRVVRERDRPVDLMVVDLRLPDMTGHDFVRRAGRSVPVLYVSGDVASLVREAPHCGVGTALAKPFDVCDLLHHAGRLLGRSASDGPGAS